MAHKYDLLLVQTKTDEKKRLKPWYKERLETKYIKPRKLRGNSETLVGSAWTFLEKGRDDFRDGLPPEANYNYVKKTRSGLGPHITGSDESVNTTTKAATRFTKNEACYSRSLPLQQQRRGRVDDIEFNLMQHPLALFPHLEESLPPDVFEDVVEILDPEMNIDSETGDDEIQEGSEKDSEEENQSNAQDESIRSGESGKISNPDSDKDQAKLTYKWKPKQEEVAKEESKRASRKKAESPTSDARIQEVTKEFCEWVAGLGGQSNNIEESTVMSLFASGYETKPALSVPIHVVELTNVPPELRMNTGSPLPKPSDTRQVPEADKDKQAKGKYVPSWVKVKYGAWYLSPKTWKARPKDEPLQDPKEQQDKTLSESKKKSHKLDAVLSSMHGAKAFKEFIDKKNTRVPEFLEAVSDQQEQVKAEAEETQERRKSRSISTQHTQFGTSQNYVF
ncbi:FAM47 [Porites harrisoni]